MTVRVAGRSSRSSSPAHSATRRDRTRRSLATVLSATLIGSALTLSPVGSVYASELPVSTVAELETALASAADGDVVKLASGFPSTATVAARLSVASGDKVSVSLNGHDLTITSSSSGGTLSVQAGSSLTVTGAGTLAILNTSTGSSAVAGGGTIRVSSATLVVTGTTGYGANAGSYAYAGSGGAGIVGDLIVENQGVVSITGGTGGGARAGANSFGGHGAAAITGDLTVTDGSTATLTGGSGGSADGSTGNHGGNGAAAVGGNLTVDDESFATVTGGSGGPASGASNQFSGPGGPGVAGATTVGDGASVAANGGSAGSAAAAINAQRAAGASGLAGSVTVGAGSLTVTGGSGSPDGSVISAGSDVSIDAGGTLTITGGTWSLTAAANVVNRGRIVNAGTISGDGTLHNRGTLKNSGTVSVSVDGNNYRLSFDSDGGSATPDIQLYAPTLADAGVDLAVPTLAHSVFVSWNTVDGLTPIEGETELTTRATSSGLLPLIAVWSEATISGDPVEGETLTATLTDPSLPVTYQWTADGVTIVAATARTFTPGGAEVGKAIAVEVTFAGLSGYASGSTATTTPTSTVLGLFAYGEIAVHGTPRFGEVLTADTDGVFDPTPTSLSFQWYTHEPNGNGGFTDSVIPGATASTFTPAAGQVGSALRVAVSPTLAGYPTTALWSDATAAVLPAIFATVPIVGIVGQPLVDSRLHAELTGSFEPTAFVTYQWLANGVPIPGASDEHYAVTDGDLGTNISVLVTGERLGYQTEEIESDRVDPVLRQFSAFPLAISGTARVGETISVDPAEGFEPFDGVDFSFVWSSGDGIGPWTTIDGADSASFTIPGYLAGSKLMVVVSAAKSGYAPTRAPSYPTADVREGLFTVSELVIDGIAQVGQPLEIDASTVFAPNPSTVTVQWFADGDPIDGATLERFIVPGGQAGMVISVTATAHKEGYLDAGASSARSPVALDEPAISISPTRDIHPGTELTITGERFVAEPTFRIELHSDPVALTTATPDSDGAFTASAIVPEATDAGDHTVVVLDADGTIVAEARITVSAAATPADSGTPDPTALAATGTSVPMALLYGGLLAALLGAASLVAIRRRRTGAVDRAH